MDKFTFTELAESEPFDILTISPTAPFTQSKEYGEWQKGLGREVKRFVIKRSDAEKNTGAEIDTGIQTEEIIGFFQTIKFNLPFGKNFVYIPYGPIILDSYSDSEKFPNLLSELKKYLTNAEWTKNSIFIRLDFSLVSGNSESRESLESTEKIADIFSAYFKRPKKNAYKSAYLQPRAEWYLDITDTEENLLKRMHEKTRYVINLAARKGIQTEIVEKDFKKYFEDFYSLLKSTADRNGFSLHSKKYYEHIFNRIEKTSGAFLSVARCENKILVINLVEKYGFVAHFIFGGSSNEQRNLSPSHRAHFEGIVHAKKIGCESYNFGGVTIKDGAKEGPKEASNESWSGISSFKKKFGGHALVHPHCYDLVIKQSWYQLYLARKVLKSMFRP